MVEQVVTAKYTRPKVGIKRKENIGGMYPSCQHCGKAIYGRYYDNRKMSCDDCKKEQTRQQSKRAAIKRKLKLQTV
jgi:exosome complex RNA-binding protein Csl4